MRWMNSEGPLTSAMDNVLASRMGEAATAVKPGGDLIDRGLSLRAELEKMGFEVHYAGEPVHRNEALKDMSGEDDTP